MINSLLNKKAVVGDKMIRSVSTLPNTAFFSVLYTKILSLFQSYGSKYSFCNFWVQSNNKNDVTAIICKFYSAITICSVGEANVDELCEFSNTIGYTELISNIELFGRSIRLNSVNKSCCGKGEIDFYIDINSAKQCYNLFNQETKEINLPEFDSWYVDISHRIRHNSAFLFREDNGAAFCLLGGLNALINGFAVAAEYRKKGIGKRLIENISCTAPINNLSAICSDNVVGFYLSCGFKITEYIYLHKGLF